MNVRDMADALAELAPPELAYEGDRAGLNIGHPEWPVTRVLVALTVTPEAAKVALRKRVELIVSHHPVIWEPLHALRADDPHTCMCLALAHARIACFSAHTDLDVAPGGVNDALAGRIGLVRCRPLFPAPHAGIVKLVTFVPESHLAAVRDAVCRAGAGVIGEYTHCTFSAPGVGTFLPSEDANPFSGEKHRVNEEAERRFETLAPKARLGAIVNALLRAHPYEEVAYDLVPLENKDPRIGLGVRGELPEPMTAAALAQHVRATLETAAVRITGSAEKRVRTVAVLGGSGGSRVHELPADIDACVTGDVGYHDAVRAQENGLVLIDAGHAGTEKCILPVVARFLKKRFKTLRVFIHTEAEVFTTIS